MHRTSGYNVTPRRRYEGRERTVELAKTSGVYVMNAIATALVLAGVALFIVGVIVGTGHGPGAPATSLAQFQEGSIWLLGAISLALVAAIFHREHHIVNATEFEE